MRGFLISCYFSPIRTKVQVHFYKKVRVATEVQVHIDKKRNLFDSRTPSCVLYFLLKNFVYMNLDLGPSSYWEGITAYLKPTHFSTKKISFCPYELGPFPSLIRDWPVIKKVNSKLLNGMAKHLIEILVSYFCTILVIAHRGSSV